MNTLRNTSYAAIVAASICSFSQVAASPMVPPPLPSAPLAPMILYSSLNTRQPAKRVDAYDGAVKNAQTYCADHFSQCVDHFNKRVTDKNLETVCADPVPCVDGLMRVAKTDVEKQMLTPLTQKYGADVRRQRTSNNIVKGSVGIQLVGYSALIGFFGYQLLKNKLRKGKWDIC